MPADERLDASAPADDHDDPRALTRDEWRVVLTRSWHEFRIAQSTDIAASLTYYAVLAVFPAVLAGLAVLGAFGTAEEITRQVLDIVADLGGDSVAAALDEPVEQLLGASHQWFAILVGTAGTLWSASGYLGAFGRGMNRILRVEEGRPFWASRPMMLVVAAVLVVLGAIIATLLIVSGPVADAVARSIGLDEGVVLWWDILKLPVAVALFAVIVAVLYWATPNVSRRNFRWFSVGAMAAVLTWAVTTALFAAYVVSFGTFERNYGVLGGAIALLLWAWLSNLAIVFGAVLDSEVERARQLRAGLPSAVFLTLPLRDDRMIVRNREQRQADVRASSEIARRFAPDPVRAASHRSDASQPPTPTPASAIALPPGLRARRPTADDHLAIVSAIPAWWGLPPDSRLPLMLPRLFLQHFADTSTIVEDDRGLAAFLVGFRSPAQPGVAYIHFVGVRPDLRGTGLARSLYEAFFRESAAAGCHRVDAITGPPNRRSQAFHAAMGFAATGDTVVDGVRAWADYDGPGEPRVAFTRPLGEAGVHRA